MLSATMSIAVLAAFVLLGGGLWLLVKRRDTRKGVLMLIAAAVILANVAIWTAPLPAS
jgi:LPXTG-motif cell wall-anchored protein